MKKRILNCLLAAALLLSLVVSAHAAGSGYTDVPDDAPYAEAVAWCYEQGLMGGTSVTTFEPALTLNRAMVATILYRAAGEPQVEWSDTFADVSAGQWYSDGIAWANANHVVGGYDNGLFGTFDSITREQLAAILWRYDGEKAADHTQISDRDSVSGYAVGAVDWAVGTGVIPCRTDAVFAPKDHATRAETAMAFYTYLTQNETGEEATKALVVYFSATGSTGRVAGYIAEALEADLFELEPVEPYTSADLNYNNTSSRVSREHDDTSLQDVALKEIAPDNWEEYDVVFVGYPIWWHAAAWPINHFVTDNNFSGKTVIPFCTSASSPLEGSDEKLAAMTETGNWLPGRRFSSGASQSQVADWLSSLEF